MIGIIKDFDSPPAGLTGKTWESNCKKAIAKQSQHDFKDYKKASAALSLMYHNKCAYCEQKVEASQVEHYRPKKQARDGSHGGYYWLGYEWSNLLLICPTCNQKKSSKFPIAGTRCQHPAIDSTTGLPIQTYLRPDVPNSVLATENALLLHPEIDFVATKQWFTFEIDGSIKPHTKLTNEQKNRAETTIKDCGLNRKKEAITDENGNSLQSKIGYTGVLIFRKTKINNHVSELDSYFADYQAQGIRTKGKIESLETLCLNFILRLYYKGTDPKTPFSCLYFTLFEQFEQFFIQPRVGILQINTLKKCYEQVKTAVFTL